MFLSKRSRKRFGNVQETFWKRCGLLSGNGGDPGNVQETLRKRSGNVLETLKKRLETLKKRFRKLLKNVSGNVLETFFFRKLLKNVWEVFWNN